MSNGGKRESKISVVIPAYNEEEQISEVIKAANESELVDEVIVVDDGSEDSTKEEATEADAKVFEFQRNRGKGAAMEMGIQKSEGDVIVFLDGDLKNITTDKVESLILPTLDGYDFSKAAFQRRGGRVTELTAKPLLNMFFPEVDFEQPLSGQVAMKKRIAKKLNFEPRFKVDIALLIDATMKGCRIKEVPIGKIQHDSKKLGDLKGMANEVAETIIEKAREYGRLEA